LAPPAPAKTGRAKQREDAGRGDFDGEDEGCGDQAVGLTLRRDGFGERRRAPESAGERRRAPESAGERRGTPGNVVSLPLMPHSPSSLLSESIAALFRSIVNGVHACSGKNVCVPRTTPEPRSSNGAAEASPDQVQRESRGMTVDGVQAARVGVSGARHRGGKAAPECSIVWELRRDAAGHGGFGSTAATGEESDRRIVFRRGRDL
jgi:hypothetical protein